MRKALVVGIDYYKSVGRLYGCVNDAHSVKEALSRHADGSVNFGVKLLSSFGPDSAIPKRELREAVKDLFLGDGEIALFYFSGHGHIEDTGGYLCASDTESGDDGLSMSDVMTYANQCEFANRVIVLDSCHSGLVGSSHQMGVFSELKDGTTILTASTAEQYATEQNGGGVFTNLFVDALHGAASNLVGDITPGAVYAHIDQSLGPWAQRPVFKTNVKSFVSLREVKPPIDLDDLRRITEFFPEPGYSFRLDPSYEPERSEADKNDPNVPPPDPNKNEVFAILQKFNRVNLVTPEDAPHMWHAAMQSKSCKLTVLGEHYRRLVATDRI